nr:putative reverse transcriptase domain-containing protein [Tanacetum cinerariifolium]
MQAAHDRQNSYADLKQRVRDVAYKLDLPEELSRVHNTFHVSNLKKCHADEPLAVPLDGLHFDDKLHFVEEPVEIMDREVKRLKQSQIPLIKVRWNSKRGLEFTREREDQFRKKYPHLFARTASTYHFIKEQVKNEVVELYFVRIEYQLVDIFTKALGRERLEFLINKLGMRIVLAHYQEGVQGEDFTEVPDDETTLTFLIDRGYKVPLHKHPSMFVDHMHQPWRTLAVFIYKCLFDKTTKQRQGKKITDTPKDPFEVLEESDLEPVKRQTGSKSTRGVVIQDPLSVPKQKLADKSLKLEEEESTRQVHATFEKIVTESELKSARRRPSGIAFRDTSSVSKKMSINLSQKLKGVQTLTPEEKLAADTIQALKASRQSNKSQPLAGGSSEGTGTKPRVLDEPTDFLTTSSEGANTKPRVPDEEKGTSAAKADVIIDWGSEEKSEYSEEENVDEEIVWESTDEDEEKKDDDDDDDANDD